MCVYLGAVYLGMIPVRRGLVTLRSCVLKLCARTLENIKRILAPAALGCISDLGMREIRDARIWPKSVNHDELTIFTQLADLRVTVKT